MKKPWVIAFLSIIPGLGFLVIRKITAGLSVFFLTVIFIGICFIWPNESVIAASGTLAFITWITQIYYAVIVANRQTQEEAGDIPAARKIEKTPPPTGARIGEKMAHKAGQRMMELLLTEEHLQIAVEGQIGAPTLGQFLLFGSASARKVRTIYVGLTESDLVFVFTDSLGKPLELKRYSLNQEILVEVKEGILADDILFVIQQAKPIVVRVSKLQRPVTRKLVGLLSCKTGIAHVSPYV